METAEPEMAYAGVFKRRIKFVINYNDVKPFSEVIKIETEFLTSKCVEQGCSIFFKSARFDNVKVLEESRANNI